MSQKRDARSAALIAFCLLVLPAAAAAEEAEKDCDGSTYDIVTCQKANLAILEKRLAAAYAKALEMADNVKQRKQLEIAQEQWLKFRDVDCDYYELGEGTIARIRGGICMLDLTRARAKELQEAVEP
jgi:uncharacterized protein YecT (DUF1311 family)